MTGGYDPAPGVVGSANADGAVLLHTKRGQLFAINRLGSLVWDGLASSTPMADVAAEIAATHDIPLALAEQHVQFFIDELRRLGLATERIKR